MKSSNKSGKDVDVFKNSIEIWRLNQIVKCHQDALTSMNQIIKEQGQKIEELTAIARSMSTK